MVTPIAELIGLSKRRLDGTWSFEIEIERLRIHAGERIALVGRSGSGKSTLIDLLSLALKPDDGGTYALKPERRGRAVDVTALWRRGADAALTELRRRMFGYVQQVGGLLGFLTVAENVALTQRLSGRVDRDRVRSLLDHLGLTDIAGRYPDRISVGQRQRTAIARALAHGPNIVLADEPTAALDVENAHLVMELLVAQAETAGAALVVATHETDLARQFGFEPVVAETGRATSGTCTRFCR